MRIRKMRKFGSEHVLSVPRELLEKLNAEYLTVNVDPEGRLIYTPVRDV
jgi:hypothetical protein